MGRLSGKRAVVSAAAQGIGRASAELFAREGAKVFALDINAGALSAVEGCETRPIDLLDGSAIAALAADIGPIDILFNCAGYVDAGTLLDTTDDGYDLSFDLDVKSMTRMIRAFLPAMIAAGGGSIINFSSISAFTAIRGHIAYAAAKAGVSNFTQSLAAHLARDFNPKLRVNAVAPGFFPNNNPAQMLFNPDGSYRAKAQRGVDATPMHRMGHPNELIGTLVWLASDASSYVTGITVTVDGGYLLDSPA